MAEAENSHSLGFAATLSFFWLGCPFCTNRIFGACNNAFTFLTTVIFLQSCPETFGAHYHRTTYLHDPTCSLESSFGLSPDNSHLSFATLDRSSPI